MTSPLSPEAVAQMVADREAGTPGPWTSTSANEVWRDGFGSPDLSVFDRVAVVEPTYSTKMGARHCTGSVDANARRIAHLPDLEAAYLTLAAENATLRHDRDVAVVNNDVLRIAMDTLRAERDDLKSAMTPTPDAELDAFVDFMCGAGEFDGAWFGDAHHSLSGHFWWRTRLRKTIATLRASEAAALDALAEIGVAVAAIEGADRLDKEIIRNIGARIAALTPTADKE